MADKKKKNGSEVPEEEPKRNGAGTPENTPEDKGNASPEEAQEATPEELPSLTPEQQATLDAIIEQSKFAQETAEMALPAILDAMPSPEMLQGAVDTLLSNLESIPQMLMIASKEVASGIGSLLDALPQIAEAMAAFTDAEWELRPFIGVAYHEAAKENPSLLEIDQYTILHEGIDEEGKPTGKYDEVIKPAIALKELFFSSDADLADINTITEALEDYSPETQAKIQEVIARITPKKIAEAKKSAEIIRARVKSRPHIDYPVDKLSTKAWSFFPAALKKHDGQYQYIRVNTAKKGAKHDAIIQFSAKENGITLSRDLSAAHEWLHNVFANLCLEGNEVFSLTHLYSEMGNTDRPNTKDLAKIMQALEEMRHIDITIDNVQEVNEAGYNYPRFKYKGALLPFEIITAEINGVVVEGAIHPLRVPPMMEFAQGRKQISEVPKDVLRFDLPKTEANLSLAGYLIKTICRMKNESTDTNYKLKFDTIYEHCNMNTRAKRNQRANAPKKIARLLNYWQSIGWIKGYRFDGDYIIFNIDTTKRISGKK